MVSLSISLRLKPSAVGFSRLEFDRFPLLGDGNASISLRAPDLRAGELLIVFLCQCNSAVGIFSTQRLIGFTSLLMGFTLLGDDEPYMMID